MFEEWARSTTRERWSDGNCAEGVGGPRGILDGLRRGPGPPLGRDGRMGTVLMVDGTPQCPQGRPGGGRCAAHGCVICSPAPAIFLSHLST